MRRERPHDRSATYSNCKKYLNKKIIVNPVKELTLVARETTVRLHATDGGISWSTWGPKEYPSQLAETIISSHGVLRSWLDLQQIEITRTAHTVTKQVGNRDLPRLRSPNFRFGSSKWDYKSLLPIFWHFFLAGYRQWHPNSTTHFIFPDVKANVISLQTSL